MKTDVEDTSVRSRVTLRAACPETGEGQRFAEYLNQAAEGFFRFMLGSSYSKIIAQAYVKTHHDLSYEKVTFAELDRQIIGMFSGFTAEEHRQASQGVLVEAAGILNVRFWLVSFLFAPIIRVIDRVSEGDFYLQAIAVESDVRGCGVGSLLLASAEEKAREKGARRIALDVSKNNQNAFQMYQRHGFAVEASWPKYLRIPSFVFFRMVKDLDT